jgi:hypothetical protein
MSYERTDQFFGLRVADTRLQGEVESRSWLRSTPKVHGADRPIKDMGKTTAKRSGAGRTPPTTPEAA